MHQQLTTKMLWLDGLMKDTVSYDLFWWTRTFMLYYLKKCCISYSRNNESSELLLTSTRRNKEYIHCSISSLANREQQSTKNQRGYLKRFL